MKVVIRFLSLLLCFELFLGPLNVPLLLSSAAHANSCPAGQVWNSDQNRCNVSQTVIENNQAVDSCRSIQNENQRRDCYQRNASTQLEKNRSAEYEKCKNLSDENISSFDNTRFRSERAECERKFGKDRAGMFGDNAFINTENGGATTWGGYLSSGASIAVPLFFMIKAMAEGKGLLKCRPASIVLLYSGGASLLIGELVSLRQHYVNLKEMDEARQAMSVSENTGNADDNRVMATEAQSQAFELLAQNEDSIAQVARTKKITYGIAEGLFSAGAIMAAVEMFQIKAAYAALGNPTTAPAAAATIKRLTCGADPQGKTSTASTSPLTPNSSSASTSSGASTAAAAAAATPALGGQGSDQSPPAAPGPSPSAPVPPPAEDNGPSCESYRNPNKCTSMGCQWNLGGCFSSVDIDDILNLKIKTKAAKNIQHAKSYRELMELMAEIESLEFENYSRTYYYEDNPLMSAFDELSFFHKTSLIVSQSLIPTSYAFIPPSQDFRLLGDDFDVLEILAQSIKSSPTSGTTATKAKSEVKGFWNKAIYTPSGRLGVNGLLLSWMEVMRTHMKKQQEVSAARAEMLRGIKADFDTQGGIDLCTSNDREDPSKPRCYCYTSDNKPNPARGNSKICNTQFASLKYNVKALAAGPKVCIDQNFGVDASCSCRNRKGADGKNTCMKTSANFNMQGINPGTFKMISAAAGPANDIMSGNYAVASMDEASINQNAARLKKVASEVLAKNQPSSKVAKGLEQALLKSSQGLTMGGPGFGEKNLSPISPKQAVAELTKELEKKNDAPTVTTSGTSSNSAQNNTPTEEIPEFGMTEDQVAAQETQIAEVMNKDLDMGQSDINLGSTTNIFEVLSNRYQRSGMRRLFDEKGQTQAEPAAKTDISE
jgi:hypothetical protein